MLRSILAGIAERLDGVIERRFLGRPVELQPVKAREFQAMCERDACRAELYRVLTNWLSSCEEDGEKEIFCDFLYDSLPHPYRNYISEYCKSHGIFAHWL